MYCIKSGFEINKILEHEINEEKSKDFKELNNGLLNKILKYCYANTCGRYNGGDECYYCTIINYIHAEFRRRRKLPQYATWIRILGVWNVVKITPLPSPSP